MSRVLVDTSVWFDYFSSGRNSAALTDMLERNIICTNEVILAELIPFLKAKHERQVISLLRAVEKTILRIDWEDIMNMQLLNLKNGINKVGIPDLLVLQNVMQNDLKLYTLDMHFRLMQKIFKFSIC